jgi:hypothetical protein
LKNLWNILKNIVNNSSSDYLEYLRSNTIQLFLIVICFPNILCTFYPLPKHD